MTWYDQGLRFKCTGCGKCCTGEPGYVWLSPEEIEAIAQYLAISKEKFLQTYTRSIFGRISLREDRITYDCIFLKDRKCQIYPVRPVQCQTFPWWKENLSSPESWKEVARRCEGIDHPEAPPISLEDIERSVRRNLAPSGASQDELSIMGAEGVVRRPASLNREESPPFEGGVLQKEKNR